MRRRSDILLHVYFKREFMEPVWQRSWTRPTLPQSLIREELSAARSCSGLGIREPYAIGVSPSGVLSRTVQSGDTLMERLDSEKSWSAPPASIVEDLCFGLHRLHQGLRSAHGAVFPVNVILDREDRARLWSIPTAQLECRHTPPLERDPDQEQPYCSDRVAEGEPPIAQDDIASLGRILETLQAKNPLVVEAGRIETAILRSRSGPDQYSDVVELALELNPNSTLSGVDVRAGLRAQRAGIEFFQMGLLEMALETWQDGTRSDGLSAALWNNIAVVHMRRGEWDLAYSMLEKAEHLSTHHPGIVANIGYVQLNRGDDFSAEVWAQQALAMNPQLTLPHLVLSEVCCRRTEFREGLKHALNASSVSPQSTEIQRQLIRCRELSQTAAPSKMDAAHYLIDEFRSPPWGQIRDESPWDEPNDDGAGAGVPRYPHKPRPSGTAYRERPEDTDNTS